MAIQWYPGHMTQARKKAEETMEFTDMVIEVLDARVPAASHNPMIDEMRLFRQRPQLKILNKADLADPAVTQAWLNYFNAQPNTKAVALSCKKAGDAKKIPALCRKITPHRGTHLKPLRIMTMGIPNVGKSTLMTDTPGMMWPRIAYESDGYMLAASHAIGRNAVIDEDVAIFLANNLLKTYPALLNARYKLDVMNIDVTKIDGVDLLEAIAKRRSYKRHDGLWDMEKTAVAFLTDYRSGAIGRVSLETPASRQEMIASTQPNDTNQPEANSDTALASDTPQ
jgi:ribosome biogenesis GTPase A